MKSRDTKNLSLPLNTNLPATVSGINRNSPSRASIKAVLPPVLPSTLAAEKSTQKLPNSSHADLQKASSGAVQSGKGQGSSQHHLSSFEQQQPFYDANNYYSIRPSMQQIPEQSSISMFVVEEANGSQGSSNSSVTADSILSYQGTLLTSFGAQNQLLNEQLKGGQNNRYSSSSLDSGRGSDSLKLTTNNPGHHSHHQQSSNNRVSVHSCESIGSTSSTKDSEGSSQPSSSSLSSSSSTSSSFCSSSSSTSSTPISFPQNQQNLQNYQPNQSQHNQISHQYSGRHQLSSSSSIVSNCDSPSSTSSSSSCITPVGDFTVHNTGGTSAKQHKNVFSSAKSNTIYASMNMPSTIIGGARRPTTKTSLKSSSSSSSNSTTSSSEMSGGGHHPQNGHSSGSSSNSSLVAQAGPPSIAEMILHGVSDPEIIHNWLAAIKLSKYEGCFVEAGYDMATIARMTPQDLAAIGITDPKARSIFTAEIGKLNFPDGIPPNKPDSLEEWLHLLGLDVYFSSLVGQGYGTIDRVTELDCEDFEDVGIFKLGHQKKLLLAIKRVKVLSRSARQSDQESIYGTSGSSESGSARVLEPMEPPPNFPMNIYQHHPNAVQPMIMHSNHYQNHQQMQMNQNNQNPNQPPLPYQDVPIKMFAGGGSALNSPSQTTLPSFDVKHHGQYLQHQQYQPHIITSNSSNIVPSALFTSSKENKNAMRTFSSQASEGGGSPGSFQSYPQPTYPYVNGVMVPNAIPYYNTAPGAPFGAPLSASAARGRSLESLDSSPYANFHLQQQQFQYQQAQNYNNFYGPSRGSPGLVSQQQLPPSYQMTNGDNNSGVQIQNRQTVNYDGQAMMTNFSYGNYVYPGMPPPNSYDGPFDGTTTLNRPKNLLTGKVGKPVAKILASARSSGDLGPNQTGYYADYEVDPISGLDKNFGGDSVSLCSSSSASETSSIYSSVSKNSAGKKPPPPPPPKRVNSIKKLNHLGGGPVTSSSVPSSPLHQNNQGSSSFSEQVYSNLNMMFPNGSNPNIQPPTNKPANNSFYSDDKNNQHLSRLADQQLSINEDVFASCVKSLTTKFSEAVVSGADDRHSNSKVTIVSKNNAPSTFSSPVYNKTGSQPASQPSPSIPQQYPVTNHPNQPQTQQHHTLPMNKEKMNTFLAETTGSSSGALESVNVSSSSSTESMPFAVDNQGTIRQKNSAFMQSAMNRMGGGTSTTSSTTSSSSSSSATSSPMFARNPLSSLPGSALHSPMSSANPPSAGFTSGGDFDNNTSSFSQSSNNASTANSNDSRQKNVVDSLEDIEIMLANLKTQLDSI